MEVIKRPYELLVRWDKDTGDIKGAHIRWLHDITDDDGDRIIKEGEPKPISTSTESGFPLEAILAKAQADAITAAEQARAERDAKQEELDNFTTEVNMAKQERDEALRVKAQAETAQAEAIDRANRAEAAKAALQDQEQLALQERVAAREEARVAKEQLAAAQLLSAEA